MKRLMLVATMMLLAALGSAAADLNGKWTAQIPGRDGNMVETTFVFKAAGAALTGTMSNQWGDREISDGKVAGDDVSFNVHIEFNDNKMTLVFTGKAAGDEIKFKRERKGGEMGPQNVEFTAKRAK